MNYIGPNSKPRPYASEAKRFSFHMRRGRLYRGLKGTAAKSSLFTAVVKVREWMENCHEQLNYGT